MDAGSQGHDLGLNFCGGVQIKLLQTGGCHRWRIHLDHRGLASLPV